MTRIDKLKIATEAIKALPSLVRASGEHWPATATQPARWYVEIKPWRLNLAEHVLLWPMDPALSSLLDVWAMDGGKVFSASWIPERPWLPPRVVKCIPGVWQELGRDSGLLHRESME